MTETWPSSPDGRPWRSVDEILPDVSSLVLAQARPGGVHQVQWQADVSTRVAVEDGAGEVAVLEFSPTGLARRELDDDAALPGLAVLRDPERAAARFRTVVGEPVTAVSTRVASYRPGSRCVLRSTVSTPDGSRRYFVKVLADRYAETLDAQQRLAHALPGLVPRPAAAWPDLAAIVTPEVRGRSASSVLSGSQWSTTQRTGLVAAIGALLAQVHGVPLTDGSTLATSTTEATLDVAGQLRELAGYPSLAWSADPVVAPSFDWALDALEAAGSALPKPRLVFGHGSYRPGQVVVETTAAGDVDRLVLLDLDGAGPADPARDLGNAMAYLDWFAIRHGGAEPAVRWAATVRDAYLAAGGGVHPDTLRWWHAAALLKIAGRQYRGLRTDAWPAVPALLATLHRTLGGETSSPGERVVSSAVAEMIDPERMATLLQPGLPVGAEVRSATLLRTARGRRVAVRYTGPRTDVVVKAYATPGRADLTWRHLVAFAALDDAVAATPEPLAADPGHELVVYRSAIGVPAGTLRGAALTDACRRAGAWLHRVHSSHLPLGRRFDLDRELLNARVWADRIGRSEPSLRTAAREVALALRAYAVSLPRPLTPIHKDFHLGHVLAAAEGPITVLDLDEARLGDPAFDVAHFVANLDEQAAVDVSADWARAREAFLTAYGPVPGPEADRRLACYAAYTALKITKQETGADRATLGAEQRDRADIRLTEAVRCLIG